MAVDRDPTLIEAVVAASGAFTGALGWLWSTRNVAVNARDDLADLRAEIKEDNAAFLVRLGKAEETASAVRELADAVRHGAEMTNATIKNLADKFTEHAADTKEQFNEVKAEQRSVRLALAKRQGRAA